MSFNLLSVFVFTFLISGWFPPTAFAGAIKYKNTPGDMSWPGGRVPYVFNNDVSEAERRVFLRCVRAWQWYGNVRFVPTTESGFHQSPDGNYLLVQRNDIRFLELVKDVNYAWIGRSGNIGFPNALMQPMSIQNWSYEVVAHEMGHTLGFIHEHMRTDRNDFVQLNYDQINGFTTINFDIESNSTNHTPYDYESITHYHSKQFRDSWKDGLTIVATADPTKTATMGFSLGSPEHADNRKLGEIGKITTMFSNGDRTTVALEYGIPTVFQGVVKLPNGEPLKGVTAEIKANGSNHDEQAFIDLLEVTRETNKSERIVKTNKDGVFLFRGVPTGDFKIQLSKAGFSFDIPVQTFAGASDPLIVQNFVASNTEVTPPDSTILVPAEGDSNRYWISLSGTAKDTGGAGLKEIQLALSSGNRWWNWITKTMGPEGAAFDEATNALKHDSFIDGAWSIPSDAFADVPDGAYYVQVRAIDFSNNTDEWEGVSFSKDGVNPTVTIDPSPMGPLFFDFEALQLGGTVTDTIDSVPEVTFFIRDESSFPKRFWSGTGWANSAVELPTKVENGRWEPLTPSLLPKRGDLSEVEYHVSVTARDKARNPNFISLNLTRTPLDTTVPDVAIEPSFHGNRYAEHAMPALTGTAMDAESQVQGVRLYLFRLVPGMDGQPNSFVYWNGEAWSESVGHLEVDYDKINHTWAAPALGYRLPAGAAELPDGTYKVAATAFNRENPQGTRSVEHTFNIATAPPQVSILTPGHNGFVKQGWTISGTATDLSGTGFSQNVVTITLVGSDGRYWDGSNWNVSQRVLEAEIQPDGTWSYPAEGSGDTLPQGETQYSVSASVTDRNGNNSLPIAGGQSGNNQVIFKVDTTPPTCVIVSPVNDTVITQPPLLASIFNGTASDSSGQPQVTLYVKRLSDQYYWTGSNWTSTITQASLPGIYPGGPGSNSWVNQTGFPCLNQYLSGMPNGVYELIAIAKDSAGNQTQRSTNLVIDYNPVWLAPQDQLARVLPKQTAPIDGATVTSNLSHTFTTWLTGQEGNGSYPTAGTFTADSQGRYFVTNRLSQTVFLSGGRTYSKSHGVIQRVGAGGWRRQRTAFTVPNGDGTFSSFEQWSPDGPAIPIANGENVFESEPGPAKTDAAGNTYATFNFISNRFYIGNLAHALVVKFDADGNIVWRRCVPEFSNIEPPAGWLARVVIKAMDIMPDGSVSLILENTTDPNVSSYYARDTVVVRLSPGGVALDVERLGGTSYQKSAVDGSGNAFVMTGEFLGLGSSQQVIRKMNGAGEVLARLDTSFCHEPQVWEKLATDASGNLYVLGIFDMGNGDGRSCVTKYDSALNKVWRRFGPERSVHIDPLFFGNSGGDYELHVGNVGITVVHGVPAATSQSEYPDAHPLVLRFSPAGDLLWARAVAKTDEFARGLDVLSRFEVTPVGDVLFRAFFSGPQGGSGQTIYGKISNAGDLQFYSPITGPGGANLTTLLPDGRLAVLHTTGYSLSPIGEQYIKVYENPASVFIPVILDTALPGSRTVAAGESVEFKVINRGSAATYQWRKEDGLGVPQNLSGATKDTLLLSNIQAANAGRYSCVVTNAVAPPVTSRTAVLTVLQPTPLDVALDTPGRTWITGGDVPWSGFLAPSPNRDGVDAAASGSIGDDQNSWVETVVTGPLEVKFWWKISSEYQADTLSFTVNGTQVGSNIHWEQDWIQVTHTLGTGQHTLRWTYARDSSGGGGQNKAWLDSFTAVVPPFTVPLPEALDTSLTFTTGGNAVWRGIGPTPSYDGVDSAVSGDIGNNGQSWMETTVTGPGILSYWWKVSSESGWDFLEFYRNDVLQTGRISGNVDWQQKTYTLPSGSHTLRWRYMKDSVFDGGLDLAWVDQVVWTQDAATFTSWQSSKFNPAQLADPLVSGPNADANKDGIDNLLAFALNLDPLASGVKQSDAVTQGMSGTGPTDHLILTLKLPNPLPAGITYIIEVADKLNFSSWAPIATRTSVTPWTGAATVSQDPPLNGVQQVRVHDTVNQNSSDGRFMRLKVTIP